MLLYVYLIFILSVFNESSGVIYRLNDTEHEQLPQLFELESYEACLDAPGAVYCVASLELLGASDSPIYHLIQEYSQHRIKHYNYSKIDRGVCVTKTCANYINVTNIDENLEIIVETCLGAKIKEKYGLEAKLYRINCDKHTEETETDSVDNIVAAVIIFLCAAVLLGSYYDATYCKNREDETIGVGEKYLLCFSIFRNMEKLTAEDVGDERLTAWISLHGIRAICEFIVVYGHTYFLILTFVTDPHTYEKEFDNLWGRLKFSSTSIVQIFFLTSGFFMTYFLEIYAETHHVSWRSIPKIIIHRWWRLSPSIAFVVAIVATWFRHLGSGPLWKYFVTNFTSAQCRQYFWAHVFLYNNYLPQDIACSYQTWYVAADMQLYILGLIIHFMIRHRTLRFKLITLSSLLLIGTAGPILHVWLQDLDAFMMQTPEVYRTMYDETFRKYHTYGHNNTSCVILGMGIGYIIYYLKQRKVEYPNFKLGNILCWLVLPMLVGVFLVAGLFFVDGERPSLTLRILFAASHRIVIGLIISILFFGTAFKFNGCSKALLEWRGWVIPSKLSFCVYLIHVEVITYLTASRKQLVPVSFLNLFFVYLGVLVVSYGLGLILHLLVEAPSFSLFKVITKGNSYKKKEV